MNVKTNKNDSFKNILPYIVLAAIIAIVLGVLNLQGTKVHELKTGELISELENNKVTEVTVTPKSNESIYVITGKLDGYKKTESFEAKVVGSELDTVLTLIKTMTSLIKKSVCKNSTKLKSSIAPKPPPSSIQFMVRGEL